MKHSSLMVLSASALYFCIGVFASPFIIDSFKKQEVKVVEVKEVEKIYISRPAPKPIQIPVAIPKADYTENTQDLYCMAHGIYLEARNQDVEGQIQVGYVIKNRVEANSHGWPNTVCGVVYKRKAFSFTLDKPYINLGDPIERAAYIRAIRVAKGVIDGTFEDKTNGATHYYALDGMKDKKEPWWAKSYTVVGVVGDHTFLK